jgi:hypothetical protein
MKRTSQSRKVEDLLQRAIHEKRLVAFTLRGLRRRAEPHDYGIVHGVARLFFYQVGGQSRSGPPVGWRWATVADISDLEILDVTFDGTRPAASGRHVHWDMVIATVSDRSGTPAAPAGATRRAR